jgi:RNA polymerase sigma-70 factor (ECF subfamily)
MVELRGESARLDAVRSGDVDAYAELVDEYSPAMLRVARAYVDGEGAARQLVERTWAVIVRDVRSFGGRTTLRAGLFAALIAVAGSVDGRERADPQGAEGHPPHTVDPGRFYGTGDSRSGTWKYPPAPFPAVTDAASTVARQLRGVADRSLDGLPRLQRTVLVLSDVAGCTAAEVCELLAISEASHRDLLHRARAAVRQSLEDHLQQTQGGH